MHAFREKQVLDSNDSFSPDLLFLKLILNTYSRPLQIALVKETKFSKIEVCDDLFVKILPSKCYISEISHSFDQKKSNSTWNGLSSSSIVNLSILRTQNICVNNIWQLSMNTLAYIIKLYEKIHLITTVVKKYVIKFCRRHAITKTSQNDVLRIKNPNCFTLRSLQVYSKSKSILRYQVGFNVNFCQAAWSHE